MNQKIDIFAGIQEQDIKRADEKFKTLEELNLTKLVHVDILDGIFVDNTTIELEELRQVENLSKFQIDVHLMVEYPTEYLGECHNLGINRALAQVERMHSQIEFIETAKELNINPGFALDLHTPVSAIPSDLYQELDAILLMSVKAGWFGQEFNPVVIEKIKELRERNYKGNIIIDGGMSDQTICQCFDAGADQFAVNSFFWNSSDKKQVIQIQCQNNNL